MTRGVFLLLSAVFCIMALTDGSQAGPGTIKKGEQKVNPFPDHPGIIRMIDMQDKSVRELSASDAPESVRFAYINKEGKEVEASQNPVERVPIVEIHFIPLDSKGNIVPKDRATVIRRKEFGPDHRPLRSSTMTK